MSNDFRCKREPWGGLPKAIDRVRHSCAQPDTTQRKDVADVNHLGRCHGHVKNCQKSHKSHVQTPELGFFFL
jgi:hypothetical protein